jgi:peptide/nickel transport system substrate-binding protein
MRVLALLAVVAICAAACDSSSPSAQQSSSGVKQGGTLRIGTIEGVDSLNPFVGFAQDSYNTWTQIYPQLVQYDTRTLKFIPDFASSWTTSSDGLTWTFTTRANAKWSDGQPLTAEDAAWTLSTIKKFQNDATANAAGSVEFLQSATASSPTTLVLQYRKPVSNVLANLQATPILPEHVWSKLAAGNGAALKTYPNTPTATQPVVSGGSFEVVKFQKSQLTLF